MQTNGGYRDEELGAPTHVRGFYASTRAYLGGAALALSCVGFLLAFATIPIGEFQARFWGGFHVDGPGLTPQQRQAAIDADRDYMIRHSFLPLVVTSFALLGYGLFECYHVIEWGAGATVQSRESESKAQTMNLFVRWLNLLGLGTYLGLFAILREMDWIWGKGPSGFRLITAIIPVVYFVYCIISTLAPRRTKLLMASGTAMQVSIAVFCGVAIAQSGDWGLSIGFLYVFAWFSMVASLPSSRSLPPCEMPANE